MREELIQKTARYVKEQLMGEGSGHGWWHIQRVWNNAKTIAEREDVDMLVVELAALLHDIADHKFHDGDETVGPRVAREWLESIGTDEPTITRVCHIIETMSFSKGTVPNTREGQVVQDADRLDAIGAIGIARVFVYSGYKKREIYNPNIKPQKYSSLEEYKKNTNPAINHFYEKLLLLKDMMNTKTGKELAQDRHEYMEQYLERFFKEWEGKKIK